MKKSLGFISSFMKKKYKPMMLFCDLVLIVIGLMGEHFIDDKLTELYQQRELAYYNVTREMVNLDLNLMSRMQGIFGDSELAGVMPYPLAPTSESVFKYMDLREPIIEDLTPKIYSYTKWKGWIFWSEMCLLGLMFILIVLDRNNSS